MAENELPPMAAGGQWLSSSSDREPHYITHEAHIKRLLGEGWQPAADPRKPVAKAAPPVDAEKEEMKQRIAKLEAMLTQVLAQGSTEPVALDDDAPEDGQDTADTSGQPTGNEPAKPRRSRR